MWSRESVGIGRNCGDGRNCSWREAPIQTRGLTRGVYRPRAPNRYTERETNVRGLEPRTRHASSTLSTQGVRSTMRTFHFVSRMPALLLACGVVALAGCEQVKSATPLSPSIAGPIAGVEITAPVPMQPAANRQFKPTEQPISLAFGNPQSNG